MVTLILFFLLSICFSFLCSIWEAVLLSITPSYITTKIKEGSAVGKVLEEYKEDIDRPLSAILTLNTIAHTVGAIGVGAQAGAIFGEQSISLGPLILTFESLVASVMTLAILILSEIIPKTIGANMWQLLAPFTVRSLKILLFLLAPFVWLSQLITKTFKKDKTKSVFSRADIMAMAEASEESGAIQKSESTIIGNLMKLKDIKVSDIMTPRTVLRTASKRTSVKEFYEKYRPIRFSRIPIYDEKQDEIVGLALKDEILQELAEDRDQTILEEISRPINLVRDHMSLQALFDNLISEKQHLSAVMDQYGSLVGLVTMEDLMETLLGLEITDEYDKVEDLQRFARKKWEERAKGLGLIE